MSEQKSRTCMVHEIDDLIRALEAKTEHDERARILVFVRDFHGQVTEAYELAKRRYDEARQSERKDNELYQEGKKDALLDVLMGIDYLSRGIS